jgi:hypothetical protein
MAGTSLEKHAGAVAAGGHGEVEPARHAVLRYNPDAPSEDWGWHGQWKLFASRGSKVLLTIFTAVMFLMLFGNHVSHVEDWYLVTTGVTLIIWLGAREAAARTERRRRP